MEERRELLYELAAEHNPCSVRHLYYRAVVAGMPGITKTESGYVKVQRLALEMRRAKAIPYHWITDNTRTRYQVDTWDGPDEAIASWANAYRRDLWSSSRSLVEVWCESESIAGTIRRKTYEWAVGLFVIRGQSSETFVHNAAEQWAYDKYERSPAVLYIGDHDPAGLEIENSLATKLAGFYQNYGGDPDRIEWHRVGVTWDQVEAGDLPGSPPKKAYGYPKAVEAEALPPGELVALLDDAISSYVNQRELDLILAAEADERAGLLALAGGVR